MMVSSRCHRFEMVSLPDRQHRRLQSRPALNVLDYAPYGMSGLFTFPISKGLSNLDFFQLTRRVEPRVRNNVVGSE